MGLPCYLSCPKDLKIYFVIKSVKPWNFKYVSRLVNMIISNKIDCNLISGKTAGLELYNTRKGKAGGVDCRYPSPDKTFTPSQGGVFVAFPSPWLSSQHEANNRPTSNTTANCSIPTGLYTRRRVGLQWLSHQLQDRRAALPSGEWIHHQDEGWDGLWSCHPRIGGRWRHGPYH